MTRIGAGIVLAFAAVAAATAQDLQLHGFVDARLVLAPGERSWIDGGLGKTRYGDGGAQARFGAAALVASAQFTPALLGYADVQAQGGDGTRAELVEAYLRYRPVSLTPWRWSLKAGSFFPPVSLENDAIGWTSPWTVTPSAINSWVGEELRATGAEFRLERRAPQAGWELAAGLFGYNDPAGELLAARGWSLSDFTAGAGRQLREPDVYAADEGATPPLRYRPFVELDHRPGWYAEAAWHDDAFGSLRLLRYDNRADASRSSTYDGHTTFAWRTQFWSLGARTQWGGVELLAQAMDGRTLIHPVPAFVGESDFHAGYLLAGWTRGAWRPALRVDFFSLRQIPAGPLPLSEHGHALTAALNWRPQAWLRLSAEAVHVDSWRLQRRLEGEAPRRAETQVLLNARLLF